MLLAGGQSLGTECFLLATFVVPATTVTTYTIIPILPKNVDTTVRLILHGLALTLNVELGPSLESQRGGYIGCRLSSVPFFTSCRERGNLVGLVTSFGNR